MANLVTLVLSIKYELSQIPQEKVIGKIGLVSNPNYALVGWLAGPSLKMFKTTFERRMACSCGYVMTRIAKGS